MKHLESNIELKTNNINNGDQTNNNDVNLVESHVSGPKLLENGTNVTNFKSNSDGRYTKEDEDLIEQDLSDVEDNYEEPSVQRYLPGIYVDVKLKTKTMERYGGKIAIPMIVDFYSECLKKYGEEKNFVYEESYLEHMRVKEDELWPELNKMPKGSTDPGSDFQTQTTLDNKQVLNPSDQQKNVVFDENLDDVIWLKNRPNDPLLRCIRSITDRLNIQGIVGDPTSYLKKGGDDMHYDMDDPFFDDSAMLSELKMSKSDILLNRAMEREFSDWSEEEQDLDYTYVEPEDFVADYYSNFEKALRLQDVMEAQPKLFFDPAGWRVYLSKIPRYFVPIYNEFENSTKRITEPITDKMLRLKIKDLLESIFKKLLKIQDYGKISVRSKSTKTNSNKVKTNETAKENNDTAANDETKLEDAVVVKEEPPDGSDNVDSSELRGDGRSPDHPDLVMDRDPENESKSETHYQRENDVENKVDLEMKEESEDKREAENLEKLEKDKENGESVTDTGKEEKDKDKVHNKSKAVHREVLQENFKKRGLNCLLQFRLLDLNGKILRWIVKSITSMTNCCSEYEIHSEWFFIVIAHNEKLIGEHSNKIRTKLTAKLQSMRPKRAETIVSLVSESSKTLTKSLGLLRKLLKEHRDLTYNKAGRPSSKVNQENNKKKSLIEISLDSARDDHDEYMGLNQSILESVVQDKTYHETGLEQQPEQDLDQEQENGEGGDGENNENNSDNDNSSNNNKDEEENNTDDNESKSEDENENDNENDNEEQMDLEMKEESEVEGLDREDDGLSPLVGNLLSSTTQDDNGYSSFEKNNLQETRSQDGNVPEAEESGSNSSNYSEVTNNQLLEFLETHSSDSRVDIQETITPLDKLGFFPEVSESNGNVDSSELRGDGRSPDHQDLALDRDTDNENKTETLDEKEQEQERGLEEIARISNENKEDLEMKETEDKREAENLEKLEKDKENLTEDTAKEEKEKKEPEQKEDDLETILKQSKIMKRIKDISSLFRLVGSDVMSLVQMNNIAISVANKINNKEFKHVVEQLGLTHNPYDQTYKRLGEIGSKLIQELYNVKVNIPIDVMKVVVINLQNHLKVNELYEKKSKKPLLLFSNSKIKASPGRVFLNPPKEKGRKKNVQIDSPKITNEVVVESPKSPKEVKSPPRRKNPTPSTQSRLSPTRIKEEGNQQVSEPSVKKKKTQRTSRVNSLKDLLLSRFRN